MFALFLEFGARTRPQDLWPFLISETGLNFLVWNQGEIHPGNRAHVKRPLGLKEIPRIFFISSEKAFSERVRWRVLSSYLGMMRTVLYYTVLLVLKSGQLIANQISEFCCSYD